MSSMSKLRRFLAKEDVRRHPVRAIWRRIYWRLHWKLWPSRPFVIPFYGGMRIRLTESSASLGIYLNDGFSDRDIAEKFIKFLKPGMVALDCGAHIGEYTLLFAHLVGSEGEVHAFEPDPRVYPVLEENIRLNALKNVFPNRLALGDTEGTMEFLLARDPTASSLAVARNDAGERIKVPVTTLDNYVRARGLSRVDAIKLDVEGAAEMVLRGASWTLSKLRPGLLVVEVEYEDDPRFVMSLLQSYGYRTSVMGEGHHRWTIIEAIR